MLDEFGIATNQAFQIVRQSFGPRYRRAIQEHRHNWNATREPLAKLDAHKIVWILKSASTGLGVNCIKPTHLNQGQHDVALLNPAFQDLDEIGPRRNAIDVHEDMLARKRVRQGSVDFASLPLGVIATVADE